VLRRFLLLLHPFMPHITEELWVTMGYGTEGEFLMQTQVPTDSVLAGIPPEAVAAAQAKAGTVYAAAARARNLKSEYKLGTNKNVTFVLKPANDWIAGEVNVLRILAGAAEIQLDADYAAASGTPAALTDVGELYLPLDGLVDMAAERARLTKEQQMMELEITKAQAKLQNPSFVDRAPPAVVAEHQQRIVDFGAKLVQIAQMLENLIG
jgi:valyl-tRNA synthetase